MPQAPENKTRSKSITASDAGAACGLGKYALPRSLWEVKVQKIERGQDDSEAAAHGIQCESHVKKWYQEKFSIIVQSVECRWHSEDDKSFLGASPDGIVDRDGVITILEVKCPLHSEWLEYIPVEHMAQIQLQLEVFNSAFCDYVCYFHKLDRVKVWRVYRNKTYWKWMFDRLRRFQDCVQTETEPSERDIPHVYQLATQLARNGYNYVDIDTKLPRTALPPRVHYVLECDCEWTIPISDKKQLLQNSNQRSTFLPILCRILLVICFVLLLLSFPSFVEVPQLDHKNQQSL